jgi:hypothetical protein
MFQECMLVMLPTSSQPIQVQEADPEADPEVEVVLNTFCNV